MTTAYTAQTVSFQLRAEGCALMTVIEETNDAVGHAHLISSAHHYAKTIAKPITIHHGRDWHILTVEPNGAVICECCGNPIGICICEPALSQKLEPCDRCPNVQDDNTRQTPGLIAGIDPTTGGWTITYCTCPTGQLLARLES